MQRKLEADLKALLEMQKSKTRASHKLPVHLLRKLSALFHSMALVLQRVNQWSQKTDVRVTNQVFLHSAAKLDLNTPSTGCSVSWEA